MFSFDAFFWNNEVYINQKYKYTTNEILTAYLNAKNICKAEETLSQLRALQQKLLITDDLSYDLQINYDRHVREATALLEKINGWIRKLPPYDKVFPRPIPTLEDVLNKNASLFEDGEDSDYSEGITWDTVTPYGYGEQMENGNYRLHLIKFDLEPLYFVMRDDVDYMTEADQLNRNIKSFFWQYIRFLQSCTTVQNVFQPFVTDYLGAIGGFPQQPEIAECYERFCRERTNSFEEIHCSMQSFDYRVLQGENGHPILCDRVEFPDLESFLFYDLFHGIQRNHFPKQCQNCGKFFLLQGGQYYSYCDKPVRENPEKTCRDVGARKRYDEKCKTDPIWQTYNRAYKAHYARYMKKKMTVSEFEVWSSMASELRDQAIEGKLPFETYYTEIRK